MRKALYASLIFALFAASAALAQPAEQEKFPEISTATLKIRLDTARNFIIVDARPKEEYLRGHIPKAINVPPEVAQSIADHLPKDKEVPVVFYCRGYVCPLALDAAVAARLAGYENIVIYHAGYPAWEHAGLPVEKSAR